MDGELKDDVKVRVFIESKSETLQAADMDTVGHPMCTGTNASDWGAITLGMSGKLVPQDHLILLTHSFSVTNSINNVNHC